MSETVLITGGSGFTGRHLQNHLSSVGFMVHAPAIDVTDMNLVSRIVEDLKPGFVIHLAANSEPASDNLSSFYEINTVGTCNLLNALSNLGGEAPKKILLASSANVYAPGSLGKIGEDERLAPVNHYGCSKVAMEYMARTFMDSLNITITRPFNYTGLGHDTRFVIPKIVAAFINEEPTLSLGDIKIVREFNDVRDVCGAYERLLVADYDERVVNICSGVGHSLAEVLTLLTELTGHDVAVSVNPKFLRKNEISEILGDPTTLSRIVGCKPKISLTDTLRWMLNH